MNYKELKQDAQSLCKFISSSILKKIAFEHYKIDRGISVNKVMPGCNEHYGFSSENFAGTVDTKSRKLVNPVYDGTPITSNRIASSPNDFSGIAEDLFSELEQVLGDIDEMYNPPEMGESQTKDRLEAINRKHQIVVSDPMLNDLINAIEDKNYLISAKFLNVDTDGESLLEPGGSHELTDLFTNGSIDIVERYREVAILKPEYEHEVKEEIRSQQAGFGRRVRFSSEPPELAFIVGIDDTPTGLFAHSVDATNLSPNQSVNRSTINEVMGFDRNYDGSQTLTISDGERVRLQGDCAIRLLEAPVDTKSENIRKLNLPVDNHLCNIESGYLPEYESRGSEPIDFVVPEETILSMRHYEHDDVNVKIPSGKYSIYLLPRGIKDKHPQWI